jgi:Flp pilus assembly protein TadG
MENTGFRNPRAAQGQSLIELAIILPVLLMLALGVVDYARAIQFNNILVAMSREGANLASRTTETPQNIIAALNNTAEPLVMATDGRVYITKIMGRKVVPTCIDAPPTFCATYPQVQAQTRAITGDATLPSRVWACSTSWLGDGSCNPVPAWVAPTATLPMTLSDGEIVFAVETLYDYTVIVNYVMATGPKLYSLTVL